MMMMMMMGNWLSFFRPNFQNPVNASNRTFHRYFCCATARTHIFGVLYTAFAAAELGFESATRDHLEL